MKFERVKHTHGIYDPEWLSGSLYATIPIFATMSYVLGGILYDDQDSAIAPFASVAFVPIAIGVVLTVFNAIRRLLAKRRISPDAVGRLWHGDSSLTDEQPRLWCCGDEVELMRLRGSLDFGEQNIAVTPYTRFLFLAALFLLCAFGWIGHLRFSVSREWITIAFYAVIAASILWRVLFPFRYEVDSGYLKVRGVGLVSRFFRHSQEVRLEGAAVDCKLQDGAITVRPKNGDPIEISLDGISRKHALVAAIFAAAK